MFETYNKENARKYGVPAAAILEKLIYFTASNTINNQQQHDNKTYVKIKGGVQGLKEILNEFTTSQIRYNLDKLEKAAAIQRTNEYNANKYDKTNYYLLSREFDNQVLKKVSDIKKAKGIKAEPKPEPIRPEPKPEPTRAKPEQVRAEPAPVRAEPDTEEGKAVLKIFNLYYNDIYKTPPPPANPNTTAAAAAIGAAILADIKQKTGKEQHAKADILNQIEWYFYTAAKLYRNELLKFNLVYLEKAADTINATLQTLATQHYNKNHKFKRRFFINLKELI